MACCHDGDYIRLLRQADEFQRDRLILVEAMPMAQGYSQLSLPRLRFDNVFRQETVQIPRGAVTIGATASPSSTALAPWSTVATSSREVTSAGTATQASEGATTVNATSAPRLIALNRYAQRVDRPLAPSKFQDSDMQKARGDFCNEHLFGGGCSLQYCKFSHQSLNKSALEARRTSLMERLCRKCNDCRDPYCYYGHQCPRSSCTEKDCRFADIHDKDTKVYKEVDCS